ncbi:hypothetical protein RHGRI_000837 [Rhododendron griersonianum]|uniref:Uncharacterized protein n=1 Tax=Rhododendron griersonianum TaxID=479676 RepID=A0AAV6LI23_9ERIC|nr:hypothetical protein RHGRI_000837 [Rhododendron griersonianum]
MEMAVESGQSAGETCVVTLDNLQGELALPLFFKDVESGLALPLIFKAVESGQPAGETCLGTPDDLQGPLIIHKNMMVLAFR